MEVSLDAIIEEVDRRLDQAPKESIATITFKDIVNDELIERVQNHYQQQGWHVVLASAVEVKKCWGVLISREPALVFSR